MNLNDRVALIIGRAIMRAEEMSLLLEQTQEELATLRAMMMEKPPEVVKDDTKGD